MILARTMCATTNALLEAVRDGRVDEVRRLLSTHPFDSRALSEALAAAAHHRNGATALELGVLLLDTPPGADVAYRNIHQETALLWAACSGHYDLCRALLERGAPVNAQSHDGWTALMHAARRGGAANTATAQHALTRLLLDAGADVTLRSAHAMTALAVACVHAQEGTAAALIAAGADVNVCNHKGETPLIQAVIAVQVHGGPDGVEDAPRRIVRALLDAGADVTACDPEARTAEDHAVGATRALLAAARERGALRRAVAPSEADPPRDGARPRRL